MINYLEISRILFIVSLVLLPFVATPFGYTPYSISKTFFLSVTTFSSLILFYLTKPKEYKIPSVWFLVLLILDFITNIQDFNLYLFPRYSENFLISILIFFVIFLGINLFENLNINKFLFFSSFIVIFPSAADSLLSNLRTSGTLGQANFFGIYVTLIFLVVLKNFKEFSEATNVKFLYFYLAIILIVFVKSASLVSIFGLVLGLFFLKKELGSLSKNLYIFIGISFIVLLIFFGQIFVAKFQDIYNQIFDPERTIISDSFLIRKTLWIETLNIIQENPLKLMFGYGPNTFSSLFERNRGYKLATLSEENFLFDKPHNYYLELVVSYGLPYTLVFIFIIILAFKESKENRYLILPLVFFIFFNWLDIYFKMLFFIILVSSLKKYSVTIPTIKIFNFSAIASMLSVVIVFSILIYRDTSFFLGNNNYFYSYKIEDLEKIKTKDPVILIFYFQYLDKEKGKNIYEYLIKNYPNNQAILFNLNELFRNKTN
jgi:putative inorganic carbon (HCO3(-)) transporter